MVQAVAADVGKDQMPTAALDAKATAVNSKGLSSQNTV